MLVIWYNWGPVCQKMVSRAGTTNYISYTLGCNYLFLPLIPAPSTQILNWSSHIRQYVSPVKPGFIFILPGSSWNHGKFRTYPDILYKNTIYELNTNREWLNSKTNARRTFSITCSTLIDAWCINKCTKWQHGVHQDVFVSNTPRSILYYQWVHSLTH